MTSPPVSSLFLSLPVALMEGMAVAKSVAQGQLSKPDYNAVPSAVFSHPEIATVVRPPAEHTRVPSQLSPACLPEARTLLESTSVDAVHNGRPFLLRVLVRQIGSPALHHTATRYRVSRARGALPPSRSGPVGAAGPHGPPQPGPLHHLLPAHAQHGVGISAAHLHEGQTRRRQEEGRPRPAVRLDRRSRCRRLNDDLRSHRRASTQSPNQACCSPLLLAASALASSRLPDPNVTSRRPFPLLNFGCACNLFCLSFTAPVLTQDRQSSLPPPLPSSRTTQQIVVDADTQKVLGMHMVGDHAAEIMQVRVNGRVRVLSCVCVHVI